MHRSFTIGSLAFSLFLYVNFSVATQYPPGYRKIEVGPEEAGPLGIEVIYFFPRGGECDGWELAIRAPARINDRSLHSAALNATDGASLVLRAYLHVHGGGEKRAVMLCLEDSLLARSSLELGYALERELASEVYVLRSLERWLADIPMSRKSPSQSKKAPAPQAGAQ